MIGVNLHRSIYLQLVLLPVDDDRCDLLVHEDEDGAEQSRNDGDQWRPPRVVTDGVDQPPTTAPAEKSADCSKIEMLKKIGHRPISLKFTFDKNEVPIPQKCEGDNSSKPGPK